MVAVTKTAIAVVAIALPDSINPSLIIAALYQAATSHPRRRTAAFTLAAFAATLAGGVLLAFGLGDLIRSVVPEPSRTLKFALVTVAGCGLMLGGVAVWLRRAALTRQEPKSAGKASASSGSAALMGVGIAGVELLTAFPYFAAIALVVAAPTSLAGQVSLLVLYNVIYVLPLIAIVIVCFVLRDRAEAILEPMRAAVLKHWPTVVAPLTFVAGAAVAAYGITRLV